MRRCLIDTGPLIAFFDRGESEHDRVVSWLRGYHGELITTGAVVTEAFHFLGEDPAAVDALTEFLQQPGMRLLDCFTPSALLRAARAMRKFSSVPMDFADASLIWAAEESRTDDVLTLDVRGFRTFRHGRNRAFRLMLS